jgi:hypothetical protein
LFHDVDENRRTDCAAKVMQALTPVNAGAAERTLTALEALDPDAMSDQELPALFGQAHSIAVPAEYAPSDPMFEETDGDPPSEMIVAGARTAHRLLAGTRPRPPMTGARRYRHQRLYTGKAEVAGSALFPADGDPRIPASPDVSSRSTRSRPIPGEVAHGKRVSGH